MSLGRSINNLRKNKGLTLAELADRVDSHVGNLSRIERDISRPSLDLLYRIAEALNYHLADIFKVADDSAINELQSALNVVFITLVEQDQDLLVEFAKMLQERRQVDADLVSVDLKKQPHQTDSDDSTDAKPQSDDQTD